MVPLILPRWASVGSLTKSEVWGVQVGSARIASRWSADTDFGRRGAVPTAEVVVVSFFFLGGKVLGRLPSSQNVPKKNPGKVPTTVGIYMRLHEEVEELYDLVAFFFPQKMNQVEACEAVFS